MVDYWYSMEKSSYMAVNWNIVMLMQYAQLHTEQSCIHGDTAVLLNCYWWNLFLDMYLWVVANNLFKILTMKAKDYSDTLH